MTALLVALVVAGLIASLLVGPTGAQLVALSGAADPVLRDTARTILVDLRLPRALLGLLVGASLGLSGAVLQGLLRNPLAEPGLLGVSGSAALGAVVVFYFGAVDAAVAASGSARLGALVLPLAGLVGAASALGVLLVATRGRGALALVLTGVAINAAAAALTAVALNLAPSLYAVLEITFWLLGSLADRSLDHVLVAAPLCVAGLAVLASTGRALDALALGDDTAASLGFDVGRTRRRALVGVALCTGAAVAVSGAIGFVGLVAPHLVRRAAGARPSAVLLPAALAGAALLLGADVVARLLPTATELQLGVVTALVGAPFLVRLLRRA
jgi:iron complex transport system permease protein